MLPTFKKIRIDKDDEAALTFLTVPAERCEVMDTLKEHQGKSEPMFLLYRVMLLQIALRHSNALRAIPESSYT